MWWWKFQSFAILYNSGRQKILRESYQTSFIEKFKPALNKTQIPLRKVSEFLVISWCGKFSSADSLHIFLVESPKDLMKLTIYGGFCNGGLDEVPVFFAVFTEKHRFNKT